MWIQRKHKERLIAEHCCQDRIPHAEGNRESRVVILPDGIVYIGYVVTQGCSQVDFPIDLLNVGLGELIKGIVTSKRII